MKIFGNSHIDEVAERFNLHVLGRIPFDPELANLCDKGLIEMLNNPALEEAVSNIVKNFK